MILGDELPGQQDRFWVMMWGGYVSKRASGNFVRGVELCGLHAWLWSHASRGENRWAGFSERGYAIQVVNWELTQRTAGASSYRLARQGRLLEVKIGHVRQGI